MRAWASLSLFPHMQKWNDKGTHLKVCYRDGPHAIAQGSVVGEGENPRVSGSQGRMYMSLSSLGLSSSPRCPDSGRAQPATSKLCVLLPS